MSVTAKGPQRGKSAHGRLQSSASSAAAAPPAAAESSANVNISSSRGGGGLEREGSPVVKGRSRRVKSARETRLEQERSDIFPPPVAGSGAGSGWGRTQYDDDYGRKEPVKPVPVRPVSPTRRNNPHPAKPFLQWKHPVRIHPHKKSVSPPEEAWKYIGESFYDDYTDTSNTGDAKNEVPITNLATIEFPGNKKNGTLCGKHGVVSGVRAQLNPRTCHSHSHSRSGSGDQLPTVRPPSPKSHMMHNTVKGNTLPLLKEWLKTASNKERDLVLQMLTAAHTDSEDTRLGKAIADVLRPDSASRVQQWLKSASSSERRTLLGVLETLAVAAAAASIPSSQPTQLVLTVPESCWQQQGAPTPSHYRSYSYPVSLRPRVAHHHKSHTHTSSQYSRHSHHHHHHHGPHCRKSHKSSSKKEVKGCVGEGDMTLVGKRMAVNGVRGDKSSELWHHKVPGPVTDELKVIHPGSVFLQPHKDRGRHFAIHPEWPTA